MKEMSNFAVLCARAVRVDGYTAALLTSLLASQYTLKGVPIAISRAIACASSECHKLITRCTLDFGL